MPRVFVALSLTPEIKQAIAEHVERLRREWPKAAIGWVRAENLHLTLKFLGETDAEKVSTVSLAAERAVAGAPAFDIDVGETGVFPPRGTPRVLWIGIQDAGANLAALQDRLENELAAAGFPRELRDFHPHLTIGRVRAPASVREVVQVHQQLGFEPLSLPVDAVTVFESELSRAGARYTELSKHKLRAA